MHLCRNAFHEASRQGLCGQHISTNSYPRNEAPSLQALPPMPAVSTVSLENPTLSLLCLFDLHDAFLVRLGLVTLLLELNGGVDGQVKHFLNASRFFGATFNVGCPHLFRNCGALFRCDRCQALGAEKLDACSFGPQVGFQAHEDKRSGGTEMEDFRIPLLSLVPTTTRGDGDLPTLSITFSKELGQSMAKQTKSRSVSGYDRGLRRSYSSCPAVSHSASSTVFPVCLCVVWVM